MIVRPLHERRKPKPVALVVAAGYRQIIVATVDGEMIGAKGRATCAALLQRFRRWQVYTTTKPTALLHTTGATSWSGYQWRGSLVRVKLDGGPTVYPIRRALAGCGREESAAAVATVTRWLSEYGVNPGSLGSMAFRLWRATLPRPVRMTGPHIRGVLYGGRQEAPMPGEYRDARYWDLGAAYPTAMASEPYPARLIPAIPSQRLDGTGIARARVVIPERPWCPLPVRVATGALCFGWGEADGWWTWRELRMARDAGCEVRVVESFAGVGETDLFGRWWEVAMEGRQLPGAAPKMVKALTSSLWGQFALEGDGGRHVRWMDDAGRRPIVVADERARDLPQADAVYIAAETTSRVRERLWREGLRMPTAVYCDTDAVITGAEDTPEPTGFAPGRWGLKATMVTADIRGPQVLRHTCHGCDDEHARWHYTVAGAPTEDLAAAVFRRAGSRTNVASMAPGEITLPAGPLARFQRIGA